MSLAVWVGPDGEEKRERTMLRLIAVPLL